jgi:hypothetical protein
MSIPAASGELHQQLLDHPGVLGGHLLGVGLLEDGAHQRGHHGLGRAGHLPEQVAHEMGPASLPHSAGQDGGDGVLEALVSVGDDE